MAEEKPPVTNMLGAVQENLFAPEVYVSTATSYSAIGGVLTITFASSRIDNSVDPAVRKRVVVARVSMPVATAADVATELYNFLEKNGFPFASPTERERPQ